MDINIEPNMQKDLPEEEENTVLLPTTEALEVQLERERHRLRYVKLLRNIIAALIVAAVVLILLAVLRMPVLQINGDSMAPQLTTGDIVLSRKANDYETGDVIAFYYNDQVLIKRMIGNPGDWIDIDSDGTVYVNGEQLDEPYVKEKAFGDCDIAMPCQVPEGRIFVMGDSRSVSVDSRNQAVGCIDEEQIAGKLVFKIWPVSDIGFVR